VRFSIECSCLAHWCAGLYSEDLILALDAAGGGDLSEVQRLCRRAAAADAAAAARAARAAAYAADAAADAAAARRAAADAAAAAAAARAAYARADAAAAAADAARDALALRARALLVPDAPDALALRAAVARHIDEHPELHDQGAWGDGSDDPACGTPCCVAGWACHLGGGSRGLPVPLAAAALLVLPDAPLPSFDGGASREQILAALRGTT
jgi:hypothetical protein